MTVRILVGDALAMLKTLPDESVQCCVTSPPYWGLRDYGVAGQLGLERTPDEYVARMVEVFREVRRVLRRDGTLWLNIGDSYAGSGRGSGGSGPKSAKQTTNLGSYHAATVGSQLPAGLHEGARAAGAIGCAWVAAPAGYKQKDLVGIPWMLAFALRQPYEKVVIRDRADRAWLAAMIDGEGCITTTVAQPTTGINESYAIVVQVRMSDRECLDRIVEITGMSRVQDETLSPSMAAGNQRPASCWKIAGENAATILAEIYPYLRIKRRQAVAAWNLQRLKDGITTKRGVAIPAENMEMRRELHLVIRALNQREPIDVPSWCREPEYTIEPGWYLRSDCIWSKPNPMPESVTDRPTKSHEYVFLLTKRATYFYDAGAIAEPSLNAGQVKDYTGDQKNNRTDAVMQATRPKGRMIVVPATRNMRSVWNVATHPYPESHFATMPPELAETCIKAGSAERACDHCGAPWARVTDGASYYHDATDEEKAERTRKTNQVGNGHGGAGRGPKNNLGQRISQTVGFAPSCSCENNTGSGHSTILDPFGGAGTTGLVADRLSRNALLIELNPKYAEMARARIQNDNPMFAEVHVA